MKTKNFLLVLLFVQINNFVYSQGVTKYGKIVTDANFNTLKVGAIIYPETVGLSGQVLTTNGISAASWTTPSGSFTGNIGQAANSIVLNASENALNPANSGFYVSPIRSTTDPNSLLLAYNTATNEISYDSNKTFVINHPTKLDSYLVHACLEGPEAGVYYRGESTIANNQSVTVKLPDYVSAFATNFSIQITPIFEDDSDENIVYRTSRVKDNSFTVHGKNGSFYWIVYGQRGKVEVEPKKAAVELGGDGPYKYIKSKK